MATLLTAWKLPKGEREEVLEEVQASSSRGWWDRPIPGVPQDVGALAIVPAGQTRVLLLHSWLLMEFPHTSPVVHIELTSSGAFYIHGDDVLPYTRDLERLDRIAAPQADSRRIMTEWMKGI